MACINAPACTRRKLEDALDQKMAELISLRKAAVEHAAGSPVKSAPLQSALGAWGNAGPGRCDTRHSVAAQAQWKTNPCPGSLAAVLGWQCDPWYN